MTPQNFLFGSFAERYNTFLHIGAEYLPLSAFEPAALADGIIGILADPGFDQVSPEQRGAVFHRILILYSTSWDQAGVRLIPAAEAAYGRLAAVPDVPLDALCMGYEALFFLHWCWEADMRRQVSFGTAVVRPFASAVRARARRGEPQHALSGRVGYLAQFVTPSRGNAIAVANGVVLRALAQQPKAPPPILYAWMFHDETTLAQFARAGVEVRAITANSPTERIEKLEALIRADRPEFLISDMNGGVPSAIFEQRMAPVQIFYQFGMPFWPLSQLDWVFRVWDFDPQLVGFTPERMTSLTIPYDLTPFAGPADPDALLAERTLLPPGRLIGSYGRLAKITPALLIAVADAIRDVPDVSVVFGGSGDPVPLRAAIMQLPQPERFHVHDRFIQGHLWGHILDVFLDSFPQPGGASCLEVIAKGKPVVSLVTPDAPNLARRERVSMLTARDPSGYSEILRRLLHEPEFMAEAMAATRELAAIYPKPATYPAMLGRALAEARRGPPGLLRRVIRRWFSST